VESLGLPTFLPTSSRELVTDCLAPNKYPPHPLQKTYPTRPHRGGTPLFWLMGPTVPSYILFCASNSPPSIIAAAFNRLRARMSTPPIWPLFGCLCGRKVGQFLIVGDGKWGGQTLYHAAILHLRKSVASSCSLAEPSSVLLPSSHLAAM